MLGLQVFVPISSIVLVLLLTQVSIDLLPGYPASIHQISLCIILQIAKCYTLFKDFNDFY